MKGANLVRKVVADRCAIPSGFGAYRPLGKPLDPVSGLQRIEALAMGAEGFKLRIFTGDVHGRRLQQADFIEERPVKSTFGLKHLQRPRQIALRHSGRLQKTVVIDGDDGKPVRPFNNEGSNVI